MPNIVIPMAGLGSRFSAASYQLPKPFIDVVGKPMISRVLQNLSVEGARFYLVCQKSHYYRFSSIFQALANEFAVVFITIDSLTEGPACTALQASNYINNSEPLIIANSDQVVDSSLQGFISDALSRKLDGSVMTFINSQRETKWSFVSADPSTGFIYSIREKVPISDIATVGIYFFREGRVFIDAATQMIKSADRVGGEFYVGPSYNYLIRSGGSVGHYLIPAEAMHGLGTPDDLERYISITPSKPGNEA